MVTLQCFKNLIKRKLLSLYYLFFLSLDRTIKLLRTYQRKKCHNVAMRSRKFIFTLRIIIECLMSFFMFKYGTGIASRRLSCIQEVYVLLTSVMTANILKIML